jgi:hypothetical protein
MPRSGIVALSLALLAVGLIAGLLLGRRTGRAPDSPEPNTADPEPSLSRAARTALPPVAELPLPPQRPFRTEPDAARPAQTPPKLTATERQARVEAVQNAFRTLSATESALWAAIERAGTEAPPEAGQLLKLYRSGAARATLLAFVQDSFPRDVRTRMAAVEWIDSVRPPPATEAASQGTPMVPRARVERRNGVGTPP